MSTLQELANFFQQWRDGEMPYEYQIKIFMGRMQKFTKIKRKHLEDLRVRSPRTSEIAAEIVVTASEYDQVADMWNAITATVREGEARKNAEFDPEWLSMLDFAHGWTIPHPNTDGTQTIVMTCCSCGNAHIVDFRIQDGLVELRTFGKTENDERKAGGPVRYLPTALGSAS